MGKSYRIENMCYALDTIRKCCGEKEDCNEYHEYMKIYSLMKDYLNKYCQHQWIEDTIDIREDECQTIIYCVNCHITK